jgi:membrane-associated phospholipid phosphatase
MVMHPLLMPTYFFLLLIFFASPAMYPLEDSAMFRVLLIVIITTLIMPLLSIGTLKVSAFISDANLNNRRERFLPFLFVTVFYAITAYLFYKKLHLNDVVFLIFASVTFMLAVLAVITLFWKISIHSAGIGGLVGYILGIHLKYPSSNLFFPMIALILLMGLVMSSRLKLNVHNQGQVYAGSLMGFVISFNSFYYFL